MIYVIDTETTGCGDPHEVIEIAWQRLAPNLCPDDKLYSYRFKPNGPMALGAMATHHILPEELESCDEAYSTAWLDDVIKISDGDYIIGHNIDYDWRCLGSPTCKRIDTLAIARSLWPTNDSHILGACIYHVLPHDTAKFALQNAHSAAADVDLVMRLLEHYYDVWGTIPSIEELWQLSEKARIPTIISFGKHKGMAIKDLPADYKRWLLRQLDLDPYLRKALQQL